MMKNTVTTLTAVVALVAGISIAQAQGTMGKTSSPSTSGGSMQGPQTIGNAAFCINTSASGALNCKYASLAACEKDAKPQNLNCSPNPKKSTTGSKQ
jgi:long-subunit fatty acid transport protein